MALAQRKIVDAEDLRGTDRGARSVADYPSERVATHRQAEVPAQPHSGRPTQGETDGEEACGQS
jgi:hypothetical protein